MTIKKSKLFSNTQEAVAYGEIASLEEMILLLKKTANGITAYVLDMSVDIQFFNEAYHAFVKDEWYAAYKKMG